MSAQPRVFEGPDPERLLLEAWSVHGTDVRISEPVTIRRGGIFGFFARLHYRIEVLDEPAAAPDPAAGARAAVTGLTPTADSATARAAGPLESLIAAAEGADTVDLATSEPESFDAILEKVASSLGENPADDWATLARVDRPAPSATPLTPQRDVAALSGPPASSDGTLLIPDHSIHSAMPSVLRSSEVVHAHTAERLVIPLASARECDDEIVKQLELVGVPDELLPHGVGATSLEDAFGSLPGARPLPRSRGSLIALVAPAAKAARLAELLASELELAPEEIARAVPRRTRSARVGSLVTTPEEALDLSPGWRRDRIGLVTVCCASAADTSWARAMLYALAPSMVLALQSATAKSEDVAAACAALGGVDALCLEELEATLTPASALASGTPVARLDGVVADGAAWAAVAARALARRESTC